MLRTRKVHLTLRECLRVAATKGREDLAHIVGGFPELIYRLESQLVEKVVSSEFQLQSIVVRIPGIRPPANNTLVAINTSKLGMRSLSRSKNCCRRGARRQTRWNEAREISLQAINSRVS